MSEKKLPTVDDLVGLDPDFTGGLSSEEYVRRMRGDDSDLRAKLAEAERQVLVVACAKNAEIGELQSKLAEAEARAERFEQHFETLHRLAGGYLAERDAAIEREAALREALGFYATEENYYANPEWPLPAALVDNGKRGRGALAMPSKAGERYQAMQRVCEVATALIEAWNQSYGSSELAPELEALEEALK